NISMLSSHPPTMSLFPYTTLFRSVKWLANTWSFLGFLFSLPLVFWFDKAKDGWQFEEKASWIPSIGATYHLGIDGISFLLIMLTDRKSTRLNSSHVSFSYAVFCWK